LQRLVHAVPDDVGEAALPAGLAETFGDGPLGGGPRDKLAHVDDRDVREVTRWSHETLLLTSQPEPRFSAECPMASSAEANDPRRMLAVYCSIL
jgi:hypothetical protein